MKGAAHGAHTSEMHAVSAARLSAGTEDLGVRRQVWRKCFESYGQECVIRSKLTTQEPEDKAASDHLKVES